MTKSSEEFERHLQVIKNNFELFCRRATDPTYGTPDDREQANRDAIESSQRYKILTGSYLVYIERPKPMKHYLASIDYKTIADILGDSHRFVFKFAADNSTDYPQLANIMADFEKGFSRLDLISNQCCQINFETFQKLPKFIPELEVPAQMQPVIQGET